VINAANWKLFGDANFSEHLNLYGRSASLETDSSNCHNGTKKWPRPE